MEIVLLSISSLSALGMLLMFLFVRKINKNTQNYIKGALKEVSELNNSLNKKNELYNKEIKEEVIILKDDFTNSIKNILENVSNFSEVMSQDLKSHNDNTIEKVSNLNDLLIGHNKQLGDKLSHFNEVISNDLKSHNDNTIEKVSNLNELFIGHNKLFHDKISVLNDSLNKSFQLNSATTIDRVGALNDSINIYQSSNEIKYLHMVSLLGSNSESLNPGTSEWILKADELEKSFSPGKILSVKNNNDNSEVKYEYFENKIRCINLENNIMKSKIIFNINGSPLKGTAYNDDGSISNEFTYDDLGQVKEAIRS